MAQKEPFPTEAAVICGTFFAMIAVGWFGYSILALVLLGACLLSILWTVIRHSGKGGDGAGPGYHGGFDGGGDGVPGGGGGD